MTSDHASSHALAMRRRIIRRKRIDRAATVLHHALAAIGAGFIVAIVLGLLP